MLERGGNGKVNVLRDEEEVAGLVVDNVQVVGVHEVEEFETDQPDQS